MPNCEYHLIRNMECVVLKGHYSAFTNFAEWFFANISVTVGCGPHVFHH